MIDNEILRRALAWSDYAKGIRILLDTDVSSIKNGELREAILLDEKKQRLTPKYYRGRKRKTWYDAGSNSIHVILSNIESARELDRIILNEVLQRRGLAGIVGEDALNIIALAVFNGQDPQKQKTFLSYIMGNENREEDRIAAGKSILAAQANQIAKAQNRRSRENAERCWYSIMSRHIRQHAKELFKFLSDEPALPNIIAAGIRAHAFNDKYVSQMGRVNAETVKDQIAKLYNREVEGKTLDLGAYIRLGHPGDILLSSAPWTKTCPVLLPLQALYGDFGDNPAERYVTAVQDIKKDKHPYSLLSLMNLKEDLDAPLAVFKSLAREDGLIAMLPTRSNSNKVNGQGNFAVPMSLKEIEFSRELGLYLSRGSGKWVNYIHSIYPKNDAAFLCWLSAPGLCSYLDPSFEEKWLSPAEKRVEKSFDQLFQAAGIKKPSAEEIRETLNNLSADDYMDIKSKIARFQDTALNEAGLPKVYSVYRDILESATKIVKEFENPKIIEQENIEFSMNGDNTESLNKNSEEYQLATDMAMFMADKLNEHGIKTVVVPEKEAKKVLEESYKKDIRQRLSVALRTMQPEGFTSPQIVNINAKVSKISESANKIKDLITEAEAGRRIGNHEFLFEIAKCLGYDESKRSLENQHKKSDGNAISIYADFDNGTRLRISTHYATARNFLLGNHPSNNVGIVIRLLKNKFHKDKSVSYIENVYFPDKLSEARKLALLKGILSFIQTGNFLDLPLPDKVNTRPEFSISLDKQQNTKQEFRIANGTIYGYQQGNTIYLTPEGINPNTPIHEYTHLWARVYEKLHPEEWMSLKEELKATPQWTEITQSEAYSYMRFDENRIAGEVLATIVGNKGENLMLSAAESILAEGNIEGNNVVKGVKYFRQMVTDMAVKDVFDAEGMELTGEVTLKVLKDYAEGTGVQLSKTEGDRLAAMIENNSINSHVKMNITNTITRDAILAHLDKITALYPKEPTEVTRKADGTIVRQYGEFDYEQVKGGFEISKNRVLVEHVHPDSLQRLALYTMSSDSYGEHPNGPYVIFWDNGNIRSYENCTVHLGSDDEFESDKLSFTREGILQEKIPGDYPIDPFLEDITKEYMKTMTPREGLEPNATANKVDLALLSTWFISLPLEDKMRVFGYYHNNAEVESSPIGLLKNAMDVEKLEKAYKTAVETPFDIPEIDDTVVRVSLEKELNTAFDSLSDASKEQIYRETVAAGIPGIEPPHSQNATAQESLDSTKNVLIAGLAEAYHENQRKISLLETNFVAGHRRPVLEPWVKLTDPEKAAAIVKAAQTVNLLDREYGIESIINKEVPDEKIIETIARRGDEAFGRLFINYVDTHTKIKQGEVEILNKEQFNAALAVAGSRVYGTLISSLSQAYYEKYKEDGITLEIAATWAQELAVRIEETIGGGNFFYPGRIDAESLTNAIGKDYNESDRQLVLDKLSVMLRPFSFSIERTSEIQNPFTFATPITSDFAFKLNDNHILGIGASSGADMLESFVRQGLGDTSPLSIEEVKGKIDSFASECKVVISLDNSTLEQRPFNDLDVCLDIISMTGMADRDDRILVKEKSLAGGTIYTVANELLLSSGVSVFNAQLDENGRLLGYFDANANVVVSYANDGAVYSVNKQAWGEEGSQPQVKTDYTTQLIVDAFEDIKKHLSEKNINQLQEQIEALQKMEMPLRELSINLISEIIPQSRYLTSDMLERFDALKSAASRQMGNKLNMFKNAIHLIADNATNMNLFELQGAFDKVSKIEYPLLEICEKNKDLPDAFNLARDFKLTLTNLEKAVSQAEKDYEQYLERGERTNNTLLDRLLGRTFTPHFPLPSKAEIEEYNAAPDGLQYARDSFQLLATTIDPNNDAVSILDSLFENNQTADVEVAEQQSIIESKSVSLGELTSLPLDYERQLEMTGRIDGPVCLSNPGGEDILVCVQKDGDTLISMRSDDIMSAIDKISSQEEPMFSVNVDGQHYQMRKDNYDSFKYGQGAYAVNAETGEKAYLIFDVKEKKVVKTEKFETVLSKKLQEEKSKADKAMAQSIGQKTEAPTQKRGGGMKKS